ncbi:MAG: hypothetical protein ABL986_15805 [Vicinamibacterales bacterium]
MSRVIYSDTVATRDQEALRAERGLRIVSSGEEGTGVNVLAGGVYGYTYSPGLVNAPLFAVRRFRSYETHKTASGETFIVGFATPEVAATIDSAHEEATITIMPEPEPTANVLVNIPYSRIQHHRQYAAPNQHGFTMTINPRR